MPVDQGNNRHFALRLIQEEIEQLEAKFEQERQPTILNDIRLRLRFLKWKQELLMIAFGDSTATQNKY